MVAKCPSFELIDVLKLSTKVQLAFHKIIVLMFDIFSSSFLVFFLLHLVRADYNFVV